MSFAKRIAVNVTADPATGSASFVTEPLTGELQSVRFVTTGVSDFMAGGALSLTVTSPAENVWVAAVVTAGTAQVAPRKPSHSTAGVAATYNGTVSRFVPICLAGQTLTFSATAEPAATATFYIVVT